MIVARTPQSISVCLVAVPEVSAGVLNGLFEVFAYVGSGWELMTGWPSGPRSFAPCIVAESRAPFRNQLGLQITPHMSFGEAEHADIVIVPDIGLGRDEDPHGRWSEAAAWLRRQHAQGALVCSVCTGAVVLAESGLLHRAEATCHWAAVDQMRRLYPEVLLRPNRVLVPSGEGHRLVTAGASASWTDLVLYIVARFCGEEEARRTSKLFLFGDRSDGQLPFAARVRPRQHADAAVGVAQAWIADNYASAHPVGEMARVAGLAERTFKRRFQAVTGYAPLDYVQSLRMEEAKQMLETTDAPIDEIAGAVGYTEPAAFRRIFKRTTGVVPNRYRQRARSSAKSS